MVKSWQRGAYSYGDCGLASQAGRSSLWVRALRRGSNVWPGLGRWTLLPSKSWGKRALWLCPTCHLVGWEEEQEGLRGSFTGKTSVSNYQICCRKARQDHENMPKLWDSLSGCQGGWPLEIWGYLDTKGGSLVVQLAKNLPAMQEALVWFLGQEDLLEKG